MDGADPHDLDAVVRFAKREKLDVIERSEAKRLVRLRGPLPAMEAAFGVKLMHYEHPAGTYRSHAGEVQLPSSLAGVVEGVLGLDNRKMARSYLRPGAVKAPPRGAARAAGPPNSYLPPEVAKLFDFPPYDGTGECVAVFAFNGQVMSTGTSVPGGYDPQALKRYFERAVGQAAPTLADVVV